MPDHYPDFPHHSQVAAYLNSYVDTFGFRKNIEFNREVENARLLPGNRWEVRLDGGETRRYDALCVVNGHHWDPRWPTPPFPGEFHGAQIHSHQYVDTHEPIEFRGKRVLVVGFGNSALDIASELGRKDVAEQVFISVRRGYWIIPRYLGGEVLDKSNYHPSQEVPLLKRMIPWRYTRRKMQRQIRQAIGRPWDYGLPKPDHPLLATHPSISSEITLRMGCGDVIPKPNVRRLEDGSVRFADDTVEKVDAIVYATGYNIKFPFFDPELISAPDNRISLWHRIMDPRYPSLFFVALAQPLCAMMPIAEEQAKFIASYLTGEYAPPSAEEMIRQRDEANERILRQYVPSARHTLQVHCVRYVRELRQELQRGKKRGSRFAVRQAVG
jgi:cation diffusion facilitator CzcD-associated flavoprotein CzcO